MLPPSFPRDRITRSDLTFFGHILDPIIMRLVQLRMEHESRKDFWHNAEFRFRAVAQAPAHVPSSAEIRGEWSAF